MGDKFICVQREVDDEMEMQQRFLNIEYTKEPLAQGVLVLQIAPRLRVLQEPPLTPAVFFQPFLAILFLAIAGDGTLGWTDLYSDSVNLLLCSDYLLQTVSAFPYLYKF